MWDLNPQQCVLYISLLNITIYMNNELFIYTIELINYYIGKPNTKFNISYL